MNEQQRKALKLALEALESCDAAHITDGGHQWYDEKLVDKAITALKALAEQPAPPHLLMVAELEHFVELVRADEREACAKYVDHILKEGGSTYGDAIRARGNT